MARPNWRAIHTHLSYTVDELARETGVCKATVRRWTKDGLITYTDQRPYLIRGSDALAYLRRRRKAPRPCKLGEFPCFSCRTPRRPAYGEAEIVSRAPKTLNVRALCEVCATTMHTRVSLARLKQFKALVRLSDRQAQARLTETLPPCGNVHLEKAS